MTLGMRSALCFAGILIPALLFAGQAAKTESGAAIFKRQCAACHGIDGSGATSMGKTFKLKPLYSPEIHKMSDSELYEVVAKGKGKMPAYESKLGKDGVTAVVGYVRDLAKTRK